ncbi:MAG: serine/threonine-protein kinase, partial [Myxococcota bacterium]
MTAADDPTTVGLAKAGAPDPLQERGALARAKAAILGGPDPGPQRIGRFEVIEAVGSGGMGVVYRARDPQLQRDVAIKVIRTTMQASKAQAESARARMLREAQALAALPHPNIVAIHDLGTLESTPESSAPDIYIVMELIEGAPLSRWREDDTPSREEVIQAFIQAGTGLAAAHSVGVVHRDFKPSNVLIDAAGRVRVVDFGLAQVASEPAAQASGTRSSNDSSTSRATSDLTEPDVILGTPSYMAPEQLRGEACDALVDQYAFCIALTQMLTGELPFGTGAKGRRARATFVDDAPGVRSLPPRLRKVVTRGLQPNPARRFRDMPQLLAALQHSKRRRRHLALAGATLVGLSGAAAWLRTDDCSEGAGRMAALWSDDARAA